MSFANAKSMTIDWNGSQFLMTARQETGLAFDYATSYDGTTWTPSTSSTDSPQLTNTNLYTTKWTGDAFQMAGDLTRSTNGNATLAKIKDNDRFLVPPTGLTVPSAPVHDIEINLEQPHIISFPRQMSLLLGAGATSGKNIAYSYDEGQTWASVNAGFPLSTAAHAAAWNGRIWIAVGAGTNHTIAYSYDGITWTGRGDSLFTTAGYAIHWHSDNHLWVVGGEGGNVLGYSHDGLYWTGIPTAGTMTSCRAIVSNSSIWVAGGTGGMVYSTTGKSWTAVQNGFDGTCRDIHWNGSFWMAVGTMISGGHTIALSADGIVWTTHLNTDLSGITLGPFYASSESNTTILTGDDQAVYTTLENQFSAFDRIDLSGTLSDVTAVGHHGAHFVVAGGNKAMTSWDGLNWTVATGIDTNFTTIHAFAWNQAHEGLLQVKPNAVAVGEGTANTMAFSPDGILWKGLGTHLFDTRANAARWNGQLWVAVGRNEGTNASLPGPNNAWVATSVDGQRWNSRDTYAPLFTEGRDVAWNGQIWIAVGTGNTYSIAYSLDGISWEGAELPDGQTFSGNSIGWTGSYWVATGSGTSTCFISTTGFTWTPLLYPMTNTGVQGAIEDIGLTSSQASSTGGGSALANISDSVLDTNVWQSNSGVYNASTGIYEGAESTLVSGSSVPGEWVEFVLATDHTAVQWIAGWVYASAAVRAAYPKEMVLAGSADGGSTWIELDHFISGVSTAPLPDDGTSPLLVPRAVNPSVLTACSRYRFIFPTIYGGESVTHVEIGEIEIWMRLSSSIALPVRYRPAFLPSYTLIPTQKPTWLTNTPYFLLARDLTPQYGTIHNGHGPTYQITGLTSGYLTSACCTEDVFLAASSANQLFYIDSAHLYTDLLWEKEWAGNQSPAVDLSGNVSAIYGLDYNKSRILLGGTGGTNGFTYHTLNSNTPGIWTPALNTSPLFSTVLGIHSNSGTGYVHIPDAISLAAKDQMSLVGPRYYAPNSGVQFHIEFRNRIPHTNIVSLPETVVNYYRGDIGPTGPTPSAFDGPRGLTGYDENTVDIMGPTGPDGYLNYSNWASGTNQTISRNTGQVFIGKNTGTAGMALDISGNMRAKRIHGSILYPQLTYTWSGDMTLMPIDYSAGFKYIADMDAALSGDFKVVLSNYPSLISRTFNIELTLDYRTVPVDRYLCDSVQLGGTTYPVVFAGGRPNISTTTTYYIQTLTVICTAVGVWKVISTGQLFEIEPVPVQDLSTYPALYNLDFTKPTTVLVGDRRLIPSGSGTVPNWTVSNDVYYYRCGPDSTGPIGGVADFTNDANTDIERGALALYGQSFANLRYVIHSGFPLTAGTYYITFNCVGRAPYEPQPIDFDYTVDNSASFTFLYNTGVAYYSTGTSSSLFHASAYHTTPNFTLNSDATNFQLRVSNAYNIGLTGGSLIVFDNIQIHQV